MKNPFQLINCCYFFHGINASFLVASQVFEEAEDKISRKMFKKYIQNIVDQHSEEEEDCFDSLIAFLFASVEVCIPIFSYLIILFISSC